MLIYFMFVTGFLKRWYSYNFTELLSRGKEQNLPNMRNLSLDPVIVFDNISQHYSIINRIILFCL